MIDEIVADAEPGSSGDVPPQLSDLSLKLDDPLGLRHNQSGQFLIGQRRTSGHHTMINEPAPRSTSHAAQDLTVTDYLAHACSPWCFDC